MSYPPTPGAAVDGIPHREAQVCLGPAYAGAYYQFYYTGTTTPAFVYKNGALATPFPVTGQVGADSYGRFPPIYLDPTVIYRVRLYSSLGIQLRPDVDPYYPPLPTTGAEIPIAPTGEIVIGIPSAGGSGVSLAVHAGAVGTAALSLAGTLAGNSSLIVNNSATTGAHTATFTATNKPGTATSGPAGWLPVTCDGVQYYTPIWHGNAFSPYMSNPGALNEAIVGKSVTFGGNGVTTVVSGTATPGNWFSPAAPGIGTGYYINITKLGGPSGLNFSAAQGVWTNITSGGLTVSISGTGSGTIYGTYQISTSVIGAPVVASGTITLTIFALTRTYTSGFNVETVPAGASSLSIYAVGSGGGGSGGGAGAGGGGGGGSQATSTGIAVTAGQTLICSVPAGGPGSVSGGGSPAATTVTGNGGLSAITIIAGSGAGSNGTTGGGAGGTATGGTTSNTPGTAGGTNTFSLVGGSVVPVGGGASATGAAGGTAGVPLITSPGGAGAAPGAGGGGAIAGSLGGAGANGQVQFVYS